MENTAHMQWVSYVNEDVALNSACKNNFAYLSIHTLGTVYIPAQSPPSFTIKYHRCTRVSINSILEVRTNVTKLKDQLLIIKDVISSNLKYRTNLKQV